MRLRSPGATVPDGAARTAWRSRSGGGGPGAPETVTGSHGEAAFLATTASPGPAGAGGRAGPGTRPSRTDEEGEP
ncbi:hypothetical protein DMH08_27460 [Actinomadura sp. WAC 06369]|uniref:hypothetical protein n=1 Tax=Actinomadura rifamycini TaxID=31962 RepID=UPI0003F6E536|nr:hypothetical protein [Actinomadura rifamycini]RSN53872.1 hypothetical protein DMH08_27460 [Actinomadura sp. WAC 06369]